MTAWNTLSSSRRTPKPRPIGNITQPLAYICIKLNYLSRLDGLRCLKRMRICKIYRDENNYARFMFDVDLNYKCDACTCMCTLLYYCNQSTKLVIQSQKERKEKMGGMRQKKLPAFIDFK